MRLGLQGTKDWNRLREPHLHFQLVLSRGGCLQVLPSAATRC